MLFGGVGGGEGASGGKFWGLNMNMGKRKWDLGVENHMQIRIVVLQDIPRGYHK